MATQPLAIERIISPPLGTNTWVAADPATGVLEHVPGLVRESIVLAARKCDLVLESYHNKAARAFHGGIPAMASELRMLRSDINKLFTDSKTSLMNLGSSLELSENISRELTKEVKSLNHQLVKGLERERSQLKQVTELNSELSNLQIRYDSANFTITSLSDFITLLKSQLSTLKKKYILNDILIGFDSF